MTLAYLDECGFSPSQPVNYSWALPGERKVISFENTEGRRVNVLAAIVLDGPDRSLTWTTALRTLKGADLVRFLERAIPCSTKELIIVLDNGSIHRSHEVAEVRPALAERRIRLYYLPPYSPRLNRIEPYFGVIKHHDLPERRYSTKDDLADHVDDAFTRAEARLLAKPTKTSTELRRSA